MNCALCWGDATDVPAVTIVNSHAVCADHFIIATYWENTSRGGSSYRFLRSTTAREDMTHE